MRVWDFKTEDAYESVAAGAPGLAIQKLVGSSVQATEAARAALQLASMFDADDWRLMVDWLTGTNHGVLRIKDEPK